MSAGDQTALFFCVAVEVSAAVEFRCAGCNRDPTGLEILFELGAYRRPACFLAVATGFFRGEIRSIQVDPLDRWQARIGRSLGRLDSLDHANDRLVRTGRGGWENRGRAVLEVRSASRLDRFERSVHEIRPCPAVDVDIDPARRDVGSACLDRFERLGDPFGHRTDAGQDPFGPLDVGVFDASVWENRRSAEDRIAFRIVGAMGVEFAHSPRVRMKISAEAKQSAMVAKKPRIIHCRLTCFFFFAAMAAWFFARGTAGCTGSTATGFAGPLEGPAAGTVGAILAVGVFAVGVFVVGLVGLATAGGGGSSIPRAEEPPKDSGTSSRAESQLSSPSRHRRASAVTRFSAIQSMSIWVVAGPYCPPLGGRTYHRESIRGRRLGGMLGWPLASGAGFGVLAGGFFALAWTCGLGSVAALGLAVAATIFESDGARGLPRFAGWMEFADSSIAREKSASLGGTLKAPWHLGHLPRLLAW